MVRGLDLFKEHFQEHTDSFVVIGGTACSILLEDAGLTARATDDIDMVLYVERPDSVFGNVFWDFIKKGNYETWQNSPERKNFFRFLKPKDSKFPEKIELLSSKPEGIELRESSRFTPIPFEDEASSLSAILMDDDYYQFLHKGHKVVRDLPVIGAEHLIPLKAKAFLDLTKRKEEGIKINSDDIKKHKTDVFRLYQLLAPADRIELPVSIKADMARFLQTVGKEPFDLKNLKIRTVTFEGASNSLKTIYGL